MTLIMGSPEAEEIRELDQKVKSWLEREHDCPYCQLWPPEPMGGYCPLCEGAGEVSGAAIEKYAREHRMRSLLPSWWPHPVAEQPVTGKIPVTG